MKKVIGLLGILLISVGWLFLMPQPVIADDYSPEPYLEYLAYFCFNNELTEAWQPFWYPLYLPGEWAFSFGACTQNYDEEEYYYTIGVSDQDYDITTEEYVTESVTASWALKKDGNVIQTGNAFAFNPNMANLHSGQYVVQCTLQDAGQYALDYANGCTTDRNVFRGYLAGPRPAGRIYRGPGESPPYRRRAVVRANYFNNQGVNLKFYDIDVDAVEPNNESLSVEHVPTYLKLLQVPEGWAVLVGYYSTPMVKGGDWQWYVDEDAYTISVPPYTKPGRYRVKFAIKGGRLPLENTGYGLGGPYPFEKSVSTIIVDVVDFSCRHIDKIGGCGCGGGGVVVNGATGRTISAYDSPAMASGNLVFTGQSTALFVGCGGRCYTLYWSDGDWVVRISDEITGYRGPDGPVRTYYDDEAHTLDITTGDGVNYSFDGVPDDGSSVYTTLPVVVTDPTGRDTTFGIDDPTGYPTSMIGWDGRETDYILGTDDPTYTDPDGEYGLDDGASLLGVTDPDGSQRVTYTYGVTGDTISTDVPTTVTIHPPDDPEAPETLVTRYDYYPDSETRDYLRGQVKSVGTCENPITVYTYYEDEEDETLNGKVKFVRVMDDPEEFGENAKVYSQTGYTYDTEPIDEVDYGVTEIRYYRDVGDVDTPGDESTGDKIERRYYYLDTSENNTYLRAVKEMWYEDSAWQERITTYDVNVDDSEEAAAHGAQIGDIYKVTDPDGNTTETWYYGIDDQYDVDLGFTSGVPNQYAISDRDPDSVAYPVYDPENHIGTAVYGNGLPMKITTTVDSQSVTTAYRYLVKTDESDYPMTSTVIISRGSNGLLSKTVPKGTIDVYWTGASEEDQIASRESYVDDGETTLSFSKVSSTAFETDTESKSLGLPVSSTTYNVATSGENRDKTVTYTYDYNLSWGRSVVVTDSDGVKTKSRYNLLDQLEWTQENWDDQDVTNNQTSYEYDYRGRNTTTTLPLINNKTTPVIHGDTSRKTIETVYDGCRVDHSQDEDGHSFYYGYDDSGRNIKTWNDITGHGTSDPPLTETSYDDDNFGRVDQSITRSGTSSARTTSYVYDDKDRVIEVDYPDGASGAGAATPNEYYQYDDHDRVVAKLVGTVSSGSIASGGKITAYHYDDLGRVDKVDYDYSASVWPITSLSITSPDLTYTYDGVTSRVTQVEGTIEGVDVGAVYTYDARGRLKTYTPALPEDYGSVTYEYDTLGRKISMIVPLGLPDTIEGNGRKIEYAYDKDGNQCGITVTPYHIEGADGTTLESTTSSSTTRFYFDADGNRVKLTNKAGDVYYFVYDPTASVPAVIYEQGPTNGNRYFNIRDSDGSLITRETYDSTGARTMSRTYHFDGLGNTVALSDEAGAVTDNYTYDAWGNVTSHTGTTSDNPYQYVGEYGYYTHYQESDFKLLSLGVRFYDPSLGRFTQLDPAKDGVNWYGYVGGEPLGSVDAKGLYCAAFPGGALEYQTKRNEALAGGDMGEVEKLDKQWKQCEHESESRITIGWPGVADDPALSKCLRRLKRCLPQFGPVIASVNNWTTSDDDSFNAEITDIGCIWITFSSSIGESWSQRYMSPAKYHCFCTTVLHELIHASHGFWGITFGDPWKELSDPNYFEREAERLYNANKACLSHD